MNSAEIWLQEYGKTHQSPINRRLHTVCVPLIYWSIVALLWTLRGPGNVNWATVAIALSQIFYFKLGLRYFVAMLGFAALSIGVVLCLVAIKASLLFAGASVFVLAWLGQFYGHHVEGKKPAFFQDLFFLLIGPLWVLSKAGLLKTNPRDNI